MNKLTLVEFDRMFQGAVANLNKHKELVNKLNVFPVPDGDTGSNMYLTLKTALEELSKQKAKNLNEFGKAVCEGTLIGGRGNSGVILSQIFKGFFEYINGKEEVTIQEFAEGLVLSSNVAYQAVIKPVEGTILTVIKSMSKKAMFLAREESDFVSFLEKILEGAKETLANTPELLPILKESGVVDAGGQGLVFITEGLLYGLKGELEITQGFEEVVQEMEQHILGKELEFKYDTVLLMEIADIDPDQLRKDLEQFGDSIVVAKSGNLTKLHVHSNEPHSVIEFVMKHGPIKEARIENMQDEQDAFLASKGPVAPKVPANRFLSIVAVSQGEGFDQIFLSLGVDVLVGGGQTMNPSINDIIAGINKCTKKYVIVFPDNPNIILAANAAKDLVKDKIVEVVPTKNMVQAIPVILSFNKEGTFEENIKRANEILSETHSFSVTYSVRNTKINGLAMKKGDILGLTNDKIISKGKNPQTVLFNLFKKNTEIVEEYEFVSIYYGKEVDKKDAEKVAKKIEEAFPNLEVEVVYGGQPFYYYLASLE